MDFYDYNNYAPTPAVEYNCEELELALVEVTAAPTTDYDSYVEMVNATAILEGE